MRRIVLTPIIDGLAQDFLRDLRALTPKPEDRLLWLKNELSGDYADYVDTVFQNYSDIITARPNMMGARIINLFSRFSGTVNLSSLHTVKQYGSTISEQKMFYVLVYEALGYSDVQEQVFPKYIKRMGIRSCVYCNSQYAISAKKGKTGRSKYYRSTFSIDHYLPKSKYPYLAASFFNLYPACSHCNQAKSTKPPIFELYVEPHDPHINRNPFVFSLDKRSFIKYSMTGNTDDLMVKFSSRAGIPLQEAAKYEEYFHVEKLYGNLNDSVEEVIWKYRVYNKAGKESLYDAFSYLLPKIGDWNRFILGNYDREEDTFKRPLAKLIQDVAKQLGII